MGLAAPGLLSVTKPTTARWVISTQPVASGIRRCSQPCLKTTFGDGSLPSDMKLTCTPVTPVTSTASYTPASGSKRSAHNRSPLEFNPPKIQKAEVDESDDEEEIEEEYEDDFEDDDEDDNSNDDI